MKKTLIYLYLIVLSFSLVFLSCEKEDEKKSMQLDEFVLGGYWIYNEIQGDETLIFEGHFYDDGTYELWIDVGDESIKFTGTYSVDNSSNKITISNPFYEPGVNDEVNIFDVEWQEGIDEMYWSNPDGGDDVMKWERHYEE